MLIHKVTYFFRQSYHSDKIAFILEIFGTVFIIAASSTLALNAGDPDLRYIYPGFFIGALSSVISNFRRKLAWPLLLTSYFVLINVLGFCRVMEWF